MSSKKEWTMYAAWFDGTKPEEAHLFDTEEKAKGMLGISPGVVVEVDCSCEADVCDGCGTLATKRDSEGVPLCKPCFESLEARP